ncbi:MAG TPA: hypothetical protein VF947_01310, partial [Myxococcales bacterium]
PSIENRAAPVNPFYIRFGKTIGTGRTVVKWSCDVFDFAIATTDMQLPFRLGPWFAHGLPM